MYWLVKCGFAVGSQIWKCRSKAGEEVNNYEQEIKDANYPQIRHIKIPNTVASVPKDDIKSGEWKFAVHRRLAILRQRAIFLREKYIIN
jgi:hypothetical protein